MEILNVKNKIKEGLINGYKQNLTLLSSQNLIFIDQIREYLLTVNVAQSLLEWDEDHLYSIQIEYPIISFYNNAFLYHNWDMTDIFNIIQTRRQTGHSPTSRYNQKIDIAITQEQQGSLASTHERTLCGIELKGINKNGAEVIRDVKRMGSAMILKDDISPNSIEFCFCGFLKRFDKNDQMVTSTLIKQKATQELHKWQKECYNLAAIYPELDFTIEYFDIKKTSFEMISDKCNEYNDYLDVANSTGIVIGYLLTISRR